MSGLFLNFYHVKIPAKIISVEYLEYQPYSRKEAFLDLRENHPGCYFYRYEDKILVWVDSGNSTKPDNLRAVEVDLSTNPKILSKMLEMAIIQLLTSKLKDYRLFKNRHSGSWEIISPKDILNSSINGLTVNRIVHFSTAFFYKEDTLLLGFTLSASLKNTFTWSKTDFIQHGIDVNGLKGDEEKVYANLQSLKRFLETTGTSGQYDRVITEENKNSKCFNVIDTFYRWLEKNKAEIKLPGNLIVTEISKRYLPFENDKIRSEIINKPQRYFYSNRKNTQGLRYYDEMVRTYQPYSLELYQNIDIQIGIICPKEFQGETEGFIKKIEAKLKQDFHFKSLSFVLQTIPSKDLDSYKETLYDAELLKTRLIYVIVTESQKHLPPAQSPYFVCKAKFIGNGIPTQDIQIETIRRNLNAPTMTNIALNTYAKLGGTAWTIEKEDKLRDELVIGIGSTISDNGQFVLGIAQVFHNDGRYMTGDCSPLSTFNNYAANLENHLYKTLAPYIDQMSKGGTFRLIFHLFKSASEEYEIKAINNFKERFSSYSFEFALVHLGYGHNFRLYYNDGQYDTMQGTYVQLSKYSALLHFVKHSDLPLKIDLDKRSTFTSLFYVAKQIYWFSHLSHRSYMPAKRTVTIMYPSLMAKITEELKKVESWDYERLKAVSDKLWFI